MRNSSDKILATSIKSIINIYDITGHLTVEHPEYS